MATAREMSWVLMFVQIRLYPVGSNISPSLPFSLSLCPTLTISATYPALPTFDSDVVCAAGKAATSGLPSHCKISPAGLCERRVAAGQGTSRPWPSSRRAAAAAPQCRTGPPPAGRPAAAARRHKRARPTHSSDNRINTVTSARARASPSGVL